MPLAPVTTWVSEGGERTPTGESAKTRPVMRVLRRRRRGGIPVAVVEVRSTTTASPSRTLDWYAQDDDGNLWYFGEDTNEFEDGKPVGHAGAWEAGVDGALPGILLPADPEVGMTYRQEYYAGEAEDRAKVLCLDAATSPGDFSGALKTEDTTPSRRRRRDKFYGPDVGLA